jgi:ketosteroid isomerase-like protein
MVAEYIRTGFRHNRSDRMSPPGRWIRVLDFSLKPASPGSTVVDIEWKDLEAIKRLKYKYMRCIDTKQWEEIAECFTDDATAAYSGGKYSYAGRDAIVEFLSGAMGADSFHSSHQVSQPEIELVDENTATGTWSLQDIVIESKFDITIQGAAFYEDEYRRGSDGTWRISKTGYKRTYEEMFSRASVEGLKLTASRWTGDGRSAIDVE